MIAVIYFLYSYYLFACQKDIHFKYFENIDLEMTAKEYQNPTPTVDAIIHDKENRILLVKRKKEPYKNYLSLPGGFVNYGETVEDSVKREVKEETSLIVEPIGILGVYSDPGRDPRGHVMSTVFVCLNLENKIEEAGDDANELCWIDATEITKQDLAFDHKQILRDYLTWRQSNTTFWSSKKR